MDREAKWNGKNVCTANILSITKWKFSYATKREMKHILENRIESIMIGIYALLPAELCSLIWIGFLFNILFCVRKNKMKTKKNTVNLIYLIINIWLVAWFKILVLILIQTSLHKLIKNICLQTTKTICDI